MSAERDDLLGSLDAQRRHVLGAIDGLGDEQLRRPVLPSGWHCLGMIKHLTLADERYWFAGIVGGGSLDGFPEGPNAEWQLDPGETVADVLAAYRAEIERANAILAGCSLDDAPRQRDPLWQEWGADFGSVRRIVLHMITETACHAGHLDAARELLDGRQWVVV